MQVKSGTRRERIKWSQILPVLTKRHRILPSAVIRTVPRNLDSLPLPPRERPTNCITGYCLGVKVDSSDDSGIDPGIEEEEFPDDLPDDEADDEGTGDAE